MHISLGFKGMPETKALAYLMSATNKSFIRLAPGLEVECRPDDVEEPEHDEAQVVQEVSTAAEEELEFFFFFSFPGWASNQQSFSFLSILSTEL